MIVLTVIEKRLSCCNLFWNLSYFLYEFLNFTFLKELLVAYQWTIDLVF